MTDATTTSESAEQLEIIEASPPKSRKGGARPLLFVHGAFAGAWCWAEHFLPYFAKQGFRACALSLSGHGGSPGRERLDWLSISDYVNASGEAGAYSKKLRVYGRYDEKCYSCGGTVKRQKIGGRTSSFCPRCQK